MTLTGKIPVTLVIIALAGICAVPVLNQQIFIESLKTVTILIYLIVVFLVILGWFVAYRAALLAKRNICYSIEINLLGKHFSGYIPTDSRLDSILKRAVREGDDPIHRLTVIIDKGARAYREEELSQKLE